jgi:hypothetical protein
MQEESVTSEPKPHRRKPLDLSMLVEESAIADLRDEELLPTLEDHLRAAIIDSWSLAPGPILIGCDDLGTIRVLDIVAIDLALEWALTDIGMVRLGRRSALPLSREGC